MPFTAAEKRKEAERELAMRRAVYPGRVKSEAMTKADADRQIAIMAEIRHDYLKQEEAESPQQRMPL